jgi:uncharacterized protein
MPAEATKKSCADSGVMGSLSWGAMSQVVSLSSHEVRVLGCLLEKQRTTPDQYPLSLNALRLACNQSTNREPVVDYDEATIREALHQLERRKLVRLASGAGSRATKYRHLLAEALPMEEDEQALMTVLMLRGAQTPGELKQRGERMHRFADLAQVYVTLERLMERGLVGRLERRPGQKEERYEQLLQEGDDEMGDASGEASLLIAEREAPAAVGLNGAGASAPAPAAAQAPGDGAEPARQAPPGEEEQASLRERVERLEAEVAELRAMMRNALPGAAPAPSVPEPVEPRPSHDPRRFDPRL